MTMTRQDFERIARAIRQVRVITSVITNDNQVADTTIDLVVAYLVPVLRDSNPAFNEDVFLAATIKEKRK